MPKPSNSPASINQPVAWRRLLTMCALGLVVVLGASCSDDKKDADKAGDSAKEDLKEWANTSAANTMAETFWADLKLNDTAEKDGLRSVEALQEVADDLPREADISGIDDSDGDNLDDDGKVGVQVRDESACLVIPESGDDTEITDGAC